jgi:subtilisin family serine protease
MKLTSIHLKSRTAGLMASIAVALASAYGQQYYIYNGQRIPLTPVAGQALVQHAATVSAASAARTTAQSLAVPESAVTPIGVPGWSRANLGASSNVSMKAASASTVAASIASIANRPEFAFASPVFTSTSGGMLSPTANIMVRYRTGENPVAAFNVIRTPAMIFQTQIGQSGIWSITTNLRDGFSVLALANKLQGSSVLDYATPDFIQTMEKHSLPQDPLFTDTWGLRNTGQRYPNYSTLSGFDMKAVEAWGVTRGSSSVIVLVMDDGTQLNHPDLVVVAGRDFSGLGGGGGPVNNYDNHGTSVAGCIAAKANDLGSIGIAPNVRVASAKIAGAADGTWSNFRDSNVVSALEWGRSLGARVSNSSWGGYFASSAIDDAFRVSKAAGMVHFVAAGNSNLNEIMFPSSCSHVNAVGAAGPNGLRCGFSNYGTGLKFMAPGIFMWAADRTGSAGYASGDYYQFSGTSAASPYAAGIAALLLSSEPSLTPDQVTQRMIASCRDMGTAGYDLETGHGLLDAYRTLVPRGADQPEISLRGNGVEITNNDGSPSTADHTHFGTVSSVGGAINRVFTIENTGSGNLQLTGSPLVMISGTGASHFVVESMPGNAIAPSRSGTFTVRFLPKAVGSFNATISIPNNDVDENPASFAITGTASWNTTPEIRIRGNGLEIVNNDTTPSPHDHTSFGQVTASGGVIERIFTIDNIGSGDLRLTGSPAVVLSGSGASQFSVQALPSATISPGRSTTFALRFRPTSNGTFAAMVSLTNTDGDENLTTFAINGSANIPTRDDLPNSFPGRTVDRISNTPAALNYAGDEDYVTFIMPWTRTVVMETLGSTDTAGALLDSSGRMLANDSSSGSGGNFRIQRVLGAGTYHLRIKGQTSSTIGSYTISLH